MDLFDSPWKIAIIAVLIIVLFGYRKLPEAARSLGKSMRILKTEVQGMHDDDNTTTDTTFSTAAPAVTPTVAPAQIQPVASTPVDAHQAQIDALSAQLANLQQSVAANKATDSAQAQ
jgi:sec-independent protein translocase protein TatA